MMASSQFRKVLYENQGRPDNYIDETFLVELKRNLYARKYDLWTVMRESGVVSQQLSSVCLFVLLFVYMREELIGPHSVFVVSSSITAVGYILYRFLTFSEVSKSTVSTVYGDLKSVCTFLAFGFGLSPILMTLTSTISTDTVYAMTVCMLFGNLLFHDYGANAALVSQSLSVNAAFFASVCLASRLPSRWHTFATISLALETFALWPVLRRKLKSRFQYSQWLMTVILAAGSVGGLASLWPAGALLLSCLHLFISVACPIWLIKMQPFKNNIHGPWDEAVISD